MMFLVVLQSSAISELLPFFKIGYEAGLATGILQA
jgi:hypothetical protein